MENAPVTEPRSAVPAHLRPQPAGKITSKQREYILDLLDKKDLSSVADADERVDRLMKMLRISEDPEEYGMGKRKASDIIQWLEGRKDKPRYSAQQLVALEEGVDVPDGYYALRNVEGHKNRIAFFRLRTGKNGRWKGYQFIDLVVGGGGRFPQRGQDVRLKLYRLIREQGILEARQLYGQEIGRCGVCGRELTDDTSRAYGIGPVCRDAL